MNKITLYVKGLCLFAIWRLFGIVQFGICFIIGTMSGDQASTGNDVTDSGRVQELEKDTELRFEVDNEPVTIKLIKGLAESFGTELRTDVDYVFKKNCKSSIYTFHGCKLKINGTPEVEYVAKESPMNFYVNLSNALEGLCVEAAKKDKSGPIVLICGPQDVGKSTLTRILLNHSIRHGRTPIYVDLDVGQGAISIPGTIGKHFLVVGFNLIFILTGAALIEKPAEIEESFFFRAPIVYHFGHNSPGPNPNLFNLIIEALAQAVEMKKMKDPSIKYSGTYINTCGWVQGYGYTSILQAIRHFKVDTVLVIDQERLFSELERDLKNKHVKVIFTPKSGGVVTRSREYR